MIELRTDKYGLFSIKKGQTKRYNLAKVSYKRLKDSCNKHRKLNGLQVEWRKAGNFVEITGL